MCAGTLRANSQRVTRARAGHSLRSSFSTLSRPTYSECLLSSAFAGVK